MNIGPTKDSTTGRTLVRQNNPERGIRGIHVGMPRHAPGWLVYIPSTGEILNSCDVVLDAEFLSTLSYTRVRFPGGVKLQPPSHPTFVNEEDLEYTEDPLRFASNNDAPDYPSNENMDTITPFAPNPEVEEYFDSNAPDFEEEDPPQNFLNDPNSDPFDTQSTYFDEPESQNRRSQKNCRL